MFYCPGVGAEEFNPGFQPWEPSRKPIRPHKEHGGITCDVDLGRPARLSGPYRAGRLLCLPRLKPAKAWHLFSASERLTARFRPARVVPGRGRAKLRLSRGFPVGFATTHEPNGTPAISTSYSDGKSRQTGWIRSLQTHPGRTDLSHRNKNRRRRNSAVSVPTGYQARGSAVEPGPLFSCERSRL
jgi:hypothetical protein